MDQANQCRWQDRCGARPVPRDGSGQELAHALNQRGSRAKDDPAWNYTITK